MPEFLASWSEALSALPLSQFMQNTLWAIPAVQSVHILAISLLMASMGMLVLRLTGVTYREQSIRRMSERFYPWIWGALVVLVLTGSLLILGEPARELQNILFWTKMVLIVVAAVSTAVAQKMIEDRPFRELVPGKRQAIRLLAVVSAACWVGAVTCGRWIAYAGGTA